jgi:hypothetical protein
MCAVLLLYREDIGWIFTCCLWVGATFIQGGSRLVLLLPLDRIALIQEAPGQLLDIFWTACGELWTLPIQYDKLIFLDCNMRFAFTNFIYLEWMSRINVPKSSFDLLLSPQTNRITIQFQKNPCARCCFYTGRISVGFLLFALGSYSFDTGSSWTTPGHLLDSFWRIMDTANSI